MPFSRPISRDDLVRRVRAHPLGESPGEMRAGFRDLVLGPQTSRMRAGLDVTETETGLTIRPIGVGHSSGPPIVWFHGGGYVFGSPDTHIRPALYLADRHGHTVHIPRYRLAPEHTWPAPRDDAMAALSGHDAVILAGDSAGGHLALVTALHLARAGRPPRALLLFSPNTDRSGQSRTRERFTDLDVMVSDEDDARLARMMFGDRQPDDPEVSPLLDDLSILPPTWIEVGSPEVLLGDAVLLQEAATAQGAQADIRITPGLLHMGQLWAPWWHEARASLDRASEFARRADREARQTLRRRRSA